MCSCDRRLQQPPGEENSQQTVIKTSETMNAPASCQPLLRLLLIGSELPQDRTVSMAPIESNRWRGGGEGQREEAASYMSSSKYLQIFSSFTAAPNRRVISICWNQLSSDRVRKAFIMNTMRSFNMWTYNTQSEEPQWKRNRHKSIRETAGTSAANRLRKASTKRHSKHRDFKPSCRTFRILKNRKSYRTEPFN